MLGENDEHRDWNNEVMALLPSLELSQSKINFYTSYVASGQHRTDQIIVFKAIEKELTRKIRKLKRLAKVGV